MNRIPFLRSLALLLAAAMCAACATTPSSNPVRVTVLTYNIYHGENQGGQSNLDQVAALINELRPDVVALQEVDYKTTRANGLDLVAELAVRTGMEGLFGKAMDFAGGGYGEGILSRHPILSSRNHALPAPQGFEPRAALEVVVQLPTGEQFMFTGTHLDHTRDPKIRIMQADRLLEIYADDALPHVLAGDLNAPPSTEEMRRILAEWSPASGANPEPTHPFDTPRVKIDYILTKPSSRWRVVDCRVIVGNPASDHCPVIATFELLPD